MITNASLNYFTFLRTNSEENPESDISNTVRIENSLRKIIVTFVDKFKIDKPNLLLANHYDEAPDNIIDINLAFNALLRKDIQLLGAFGSVFAELVLLDEIATRYCSPSYNLFLGEKFQYKDFYSKEEDSEVSVSPNLSHAPSKICVIDLGDFFLNATEAYFAYLKNGIEAVYPGFLLYQYLIPKELVTTDKKQFEADVEKRLCYTLSKDQSMTKEEKLRKLKVLQFQKKATENVLH